MKHTRFLKRATKPISILLVFVLLCAVLCFPASAAEIPNLKTDISAASVSAPDQTFLDEYWEPEVTVTLGGKTLTAGTDYTVLYENNLNVGTANFYVIGKGDYYGWKKGTFQVKLTDTELLLSGTYAGKVGGTPSVDYEPGEVWLTPGKVTGYFDTSRYHISIYILYRYDFDEEDWIVVKEGESDPGYKSSTYFSYDFTDVYENDMATGGALYLLDYAWVDEYDSVYGGAVFLGFQSKYADASSMEVLQAWEDGDFRAEYLVGYAEDGDLGVVQWKSSDNSVATVESGGKVTFHKPGTVTVTGSYNSLSATRELTMAALDITQAEIYDYDAAAGTANVIYDGRILIPGTDYTLTATTNDGVVDVTVTGCGLFEGYILRQFDAQGAPVGHTHSFDTVCGETCGSCDFTRVTQHTFRDRWMKDETAHWHSCSVCGKQKDHETHTLSDAQTCTVCGPLREPGDVDADGDADTDDAVYLLLHVMFGDEDYPVGDGVLTDFNDDSKLDTDDAVYLLLHVMFGQEDYPLPA